MKPNRIIDDVNELMKLEKEELDDVLMDEKYNKALLRELVRRVVHQASIYKEIYEYERERNERNEKRRMSK